MPHSNEWLNVSVLQCFKEPDVVRYTHHVDVSCRVFSRLICQNSRPRDGKSVRVDTRFLEELNCFVIPHVIFISGVSACILLDVLQRWV